MSRATALTSFLSLIASLALCQQTQASGLDVQLKDIKRSFYFIKEAAGACRKLTRVEVRELGPLTHCHPEDDRVECPTKSGKTVVAFEEKASCEAAAAKRPETQDKAQQPQSLDVGAKV